FSALAQTLVFVLKNMDLLIVAAQTFIGVWAAGRLVGMVNDLKRLGTQADGTGVKLKSLAGVVGLVQAAFVGWQIGSVAYEKFAAVRKAAAWLITGLDEAWVTIKHSFATVLDLL